MAKQTKKKAAPVHAKQTLNETFGAILDQNFSYLKRWEDTARSYENTEGVHQMRVSFRRMRSALKTFRFAIPRAITDPWSQDMRNLANQLGPARDLDVFIEEGLGVVAGKLPLPGQDKLASLAQDKRQIAYQQVCAMLDSKDYRRFKRTFPKWLASQAWLQKDTLTETQRKRLEASTILSAQKILDKQERRVLTVGNKVDQDSPPEMHQLRIECKKLRYGAEFFAPLFEGMDNFISHMKRLQDLLGTLNDIAVMQQLLETLLAAESDPEVLQYAGGLVGWRVRQYYEIKHSFNDRWDAFTHAGRPWWDKSAIIDS
jgi:CHAD domain-containing protein